MTPLQNELLLIIVAVGLYVYDLAVLVCFNEGIMSPRRDGGWSVWIGSNAAQLIGKYVVLPNPLMPHRPLYRLTWEVGGDSAGVKDDWDGQSNSFGPLVPLIWGIAFALFVLLPAALFMGLGDMFLVGTVLFLYTNIAAALSWIWLRRLSYGLSDRRFLGLAFESFVCPPCALNLVRKLSQAINIREDLFSACRRLQLPDDWTTTQTKLLARLEEEIEAADDGSERMSALERRRRSLLEPTVL